MTRDFFDYSAFFLFLSSSGERGSIDVARRPRDVPTTPTAGRADQPYWSSRMPPTAGPTVRTRELTLVATPRTSP